MINQVFLWHMFPLNCQVGKAKTLMMYLQSCTICIMRAEAKSDMLLQTEISDYLSQSFGKIQAVKSAII